MKSVLIGIGLMCGMAALMGQTAEERAILLKQDGSPVMEQGIPALSESDEPDGEPALNGDPSRNGEPKGQLGLSAGTGFSYLRGYGSGMMLYVAPTYTIPLNERWSFHGGLVAAGYSGAGVPGPYPGELQTPFRYSSLAVFAAASYRMNDRLVLHGSGIKQLVSAPVTSFTPYPVDQLSLGATYKLGENISIGATIQMNNGGP